MSSNVFSSSPLAIVQELQSLQLSPNGQSISSSPQQHTLSPLDSIQPLATPHNQSQSCPSLLAPLPNETDTSYNSNLPPQIRAQSSPSQLLASGGRRSPQGSNGGALPRGFPTHYQRGPYTYTNSTGASCDLDESHYLCACGRELAISSWAKNGKTHEKSKSHLKALNIEKEDGHECPRCGKNDMRIDSLRRHVEKGGINGKCKGVSLAHLRTRARNGVAGTKVRTPMPTTVPLDESVSPHSHVNPLPTILPDPRSPGTNATRGLEATLAAAARNPDLAPSPYIASVHLGLGLKITIPRSGKDVLSPISIRSRYASSQPRPRPIASPRSCRSPFGGARELYSSPLSGPPSLLPDTPASLSHSLMWSPGTPHTPMINFGASPHSFQTLPSLEDDDLLPPLKNLPGPTEESAPFGNEAAQGLGLEDTSNPPYPALNVFDQFWANPQAASPSPYANPLPLPVQPPPPDATQIPQIQVQGVHNFHPQHSDLARKLVPVRLHYGNSQSTQGWSSNHFNEVPSGSGHYQAQPNQYQAQPNQYQAQPNQYPPTGHFQNLSAPMGTRMDALAVPPAGSSDFMAIQNQWNEYDIDEMMSDHNRQIHGY